MSKLKANYLASVLQSSTNIQMYMIITSNKPTQEQRDKIYHTCLQILLLDYGRQVNSDSLKET
jgi:hypothetical protein